MTDSWWLKFKRAQEHMVDIRREARKYADGYPYEVLRVRQPKGYKGAAIFFRLSITQQPDPYIAILLGDFVHNLRSALDHVVVASSFPRSTRGKASFPISTEDLWARDSRRRYIVRDAERRKSFLQAIHGLNPVAQAIVKAFQPYQRPGQASTNILAILSRLENADKHRELIPIGTGVRWPTFRAVCNGADVGTLKIGLGPRQFLKDGAKFPIPEPLSSMYPEVQMECRGTATISIKVADSGRNTPPSEFNLYGLMRTALGTVRLALRKLEPFAIR